MPRPSDLLRRYPAPLVVAVDILAIVNLVQARGPIGVALAGWLAWKGRVGSAGLALSPSVFPHYLLLLLLEVLDMLSRGRAEPDRGRRAGGP